MKLMLDSNVVIDYLGERKPFYDSAKLLMTLGYLREFDLWFSTTQANDIFYVLTHGDYKLTKFETLIKLKHFRNFAHACGVNEAAFDAALDSTWDDVEDACVYQAARSIKADAIITRNQKDFEKSSIKVFDCDEFFAWLKEEKHVEYGEIEL